MMRIMKFRAKQKGGTENGKWWDGYFSKDYAGTAYITTLDGVDTVTIDESTLSLFSGFNDINNIEIYEGDILESDYGKTFEVQFRNGSFILVHEPSCGSEIDGTVEIPWDYLGVVMQMHIYDLKIISNIYV